MATCLISIVFLSLSVSSTYAGIVHLPAENKLMYVGSRAMDLPGTQKLCKSLGGDLSAMKNYEQDLETIRKLTYEPVWLGVARIANPVHPKDPTKPFRKYTWQDGTSFSDTILEEIPRIPCNTSCCSIRLNPHPQLTAFTEVNCNSTNLPLCVITLNAVSMAKILAAGDSFTDDKDRLGLALYVLPKFTKQLYDKVEGHRKTTHPIMYVLLVVCMCSLMVIAVMAIIKMRGNQGNRRKTQQPSSSPTPRKKENGQQQKDDRRREEEEGTLLTDVSRHEVITTDI